MTFRLILNLVTTIHRRIVNNSNGFFAILEGWHDSYFIIVSRIKCIISNNISGFRTKSCNHFSFVCCVLFILIVFALYVVSPTLSVSLVCPFNSVLKRLFTHSNGWNYFWLYSFWLSICETNNKITHNMTRTVAGLTTTPQNNKVVGWMVYGD